MARRIAFYLVLAALLCFTMAFYLFRQLEEENQAVADHLRSTAKLLDQLIQFQIDYALVSQSGIQHGAITSLVEKFGRILLYDQTLKKTVVGSKMADGSIKVVAVDLSTPRINGVLFIADASDTVFYSNEAILSGNKLSTVLNIAPTSVEDPTVYKGKKHKTVQITNERYGYKVVVAYPLVNPIFHTAIFFVLLLSSGFVILLVFLLERKKKTTEDIVNGLQQVLSKRFQIQTKTKDPSKLLQELDQQVENREKLLKKAAEEIQKIKENLQKLKGA